MKEALKNIIIDSLCNSNFTGIMCVKFNSGVITEISRKPDNNQQIQNIKDIISFWRTKFRILHDWEIIYDDLVEFKNQCSFNNELKKAIIYECVNINNQQIDIKNYILHEMIHIAIGAAENNRELNEILVQDLSAMLEMISN